jgi:HK97 gp10 family phage protein
VISLSTQVVNHLREVEVLLESRVRERTKRFADDGVRHAQARVAVDTGATRRGIIARRLGDMEYEVVSTEPSSEYLEFGTTFTPPQPFMAPTAAVVIPQYRRSMKDLV